MYRTIRRRRGAFTLIELLLVLVILAVLAAVVVPKFTGRSEEAKIKAAQTQIANFKVSLGMFEVDNGRYPTSEEGLQALVVPPANATNPHNYLEGQLPVDPWNNPYQYRYPGTHNPQGYDLFSFGPDGRESNDDITNWQ